MIFAKWRLAVKSPLRKSSVITGKPRCGLFPMEEAVSYARNPGYCQCGVFCTTNAGAGTVYFDASVMVEITEVLHAAIELPIVLGKNRYYLNFKRF